MASLHTAEDEDEGEDEATAFDEIMIVPVSRMDLYPHRLKSFLVPAFLSSSK
jgi:hypothetical protein